MKTKYLFIGLMTTALSLVGCSSSFLDQEPTGGSLSQNQFDQIQGTVEGQVRGLYSMLIAFGGNHDTFGQKSIDLTTDMMSSDMAMTAQAYGWFEDAARINCSTSTSGKTSYFWSYYYTLIRNCNLAIRAVLNEDLEDAEIQNYYAQALAMRGYAYWGLINLFNSPTYGLTDEGLNAPAVPVYIESTPEKVPQPLASLGEVYDQIESDLTTAIEYFEMSGITRSSKLQTNVDVARGLLAYAFLNKGDYENAYSTAMEVIEGGKFTMIPAANLLTTGFVSVSDPSWMWGSATTIENTTSLASFWGHLDIHTYSYAWAGAYKAIDDRLYGTIPETDLRKSWFNAEKRLCPDWKFYDLARGEAADEIDRVWLNDNIFMRVEEMYLIAAEAAVRSHNYDNAVEVLGSLLAERDPAVAAELSAANIDEQVYYNWRVEMWGEGRALQTFKRYGQSITRGGNHFAYAGQEYNGGDLQFIFQVPYGEITTNPNIEI